MKKIGLAAIALLVNVVLIAQSATIRFEGTENSNNNPQYYAVEIDGTIYYSYNADLSQNSRVRQLQTNNLNWGNHRIAVYQVNENATVNTNSDVAIYSNNFQIRKGYDMIIAVRRNGQVSFTEKKSDNSTVGNNGTIVGTGMSSTDFDKLYQSAQSKWSQTSKYNAVKSAFNNKLYYFTTEQAGQLVTLVTSETRRLELIKMIYPRITDPDNYGDVVDLFNSTANKQKIEQFIQANSRGTTVTESYTNRTAMSDADFTKLQNKVSLHFRQSSTVRDIKDALNNKSNYFSIGQIRSLLSMVSSESDKLAIAKLAWHRVTDPNSFDQLFDMFSSQTNVDNLNTYIKSTRS